MIGLYGDLGRRCVVPFTLDEVNNHVKLNGVKSNDRSVIVEVDVHAQFTNKQEFIVSNKI